MKHLKYFESITSIDMDEIEDIFKDFSDKYFLAKTDKAVSSSGGDVYGIAIFGTEVIIDIYINRENYDYTPNRRTNILNDITSVINRLESIGYVVGFDDNYRGFYEIRIML